MRILVIFISLLVVSGSKAEEIRLWNPQPIKLFNVNKYPKCDTCNPCTCDPCECNKPDSQVQVQSYPIQSYPIQPIRRPVFGTNFGVQNCSPRG